VTVNDIVEVIRFQIADYKQRQINAVDEVPAVVSSWGKLGSGSGYEEFLTANMPLVSGCDAQLKSSRWLYSKGGQFPNDYDVGGDERVFYLDYNRGVFVVPSGASPTISGEKVTLTYSWLQNQEYTHTDTEIKKWIPVGDSYLRKKVPLSYTIDGSGDNLVFSVVPSGLSAHLLALATSYFIRKKKEEEEIDYGVFIKDRDITIDSVKKLAHRGKSLEQVKEDLESIVDDVLNGELESAGHRIDTYSTRDVNYPLGIGSDQEYLYYEGGFDFDDHGMVST
jgi:hypothetical protein